MRALSRILKNKFSTFLDPLQKSSQPHFISVVCGFPKDLRNKYKLGKFGDDAWFTSSNSVADVIGKKINNKKVPNRDKMRTYIHNIFMCIDFPSYIALMLKLKRTKN